MLASDLSYALDPVLLMRTAGMEPDSWQKQLLRSSELRVLLLCTRQAGKSTTTSILALHTAIYEPDSLILVISPSLRQSCELLKKISDTFGRIKTIPLKFESTLRLEFANGSRIISLPGNEETIRGFSGVTLIIIDEASRVSDDLYYSVRPMLAVSGGRLVLLSTPWGKRGFFYDEWEQGEGFERIQITAHECQRISREFLESEEKALGPYFFAQEYLCQFNNTQDQLFSHDLIQSAFSDDIQPMFRRK